MHSVSSASATVRTLRIMFVTRASSSECEPSSRQPRTQRKDEDKDGEVEGEGVG